jgi:hypothetical protein
MLEDQDALGQICFEFRSEIEWGNLPGASGVPGGLGQWGLDAPCWDNLLEISY